MATLIQDQKQATFQIGERVQFSMSNNDDNYSPSHRIVYGTVSKINKVSMRIKGVDGNEYIATVKEVKKYIDPFA
jgi:small-conductance mechanosensitive channel